MDAGYAVGSLRRKKKIPSNTRSQRRRDRSAVARAAPGQYPCHEACSRASWWSQRWCSW